MKSILEGGVSDSLYSDDIVITLVLGSASGEFFFWNQFGLEKFSTYGVRK